MKKQMLIGVTASAILLLTGCGTNIKGNELYADGEYKSYVDAYSYFSEKAAKGEDPSKAKEQLRDIEKKFIILSKELIESNYNELKPLYSKQYLDNALEMDGEDEDLLSVKELIYGAAQKQLSYNQFANYLEDVYTIYNNTFLEYGDLVTKINTGQEQPTSIKRFINEKYPNLIELRKKVNDETYNESINGDEELADINNELFTYLVSVEKEWSKALTTKDEELDVNAVNSMFTKYEATEVNKTFLNIQQKFNKILSKENDEGEVELKVENTLNFAENEKAPGNEAEIEKVINLTNKGEKIAKEKEDK